MLVRLLFLLVLAASWVVNIVVTIVIAILTVPFWILRGRSLIQKAMDWPWYFRSPEEIWWWCHKIARREPSEFTPLL